MSKQNEGEEKIANEENPRHIGGHLLPTSIALGARDCSLSKHKHYASPLLHILSEGLCRR